jgi:deoxyribodipyrimidine photolyase
VYEQQELQELPTTFRPFHKLVEKQLDTAPISQPVDEPTHLPGQVKPSTTFKQESFTRWCEGMTEFPLVNACMSQLK